MNKKARVNYGYSFFLEFPYLLYLNNNKISDLGAEHLSKLQGLNCLFLKHNKITDVGKKHFSKLPKYKPFY